MNRKQIIGLVIFIVGIVLVIGAMYGMKRVGEAREGFSKGTSFMPDNRGTGLMKGAVEGKLSSYDATINTILWGGIILLVIGGGVMIVCRKKH